MKKAAIIFVQSILIVIGVLFALPIAFLRAVYYISRDYSTQILRDLFPQRFIIVTIENDEDHRTRTQEKDTTHHDHR